MFGFLQNASDWVADTVSQLGLEETLQSVGLNAAEVGHAAVYLGIGVAAGFMTRKYFRILVVGLLIAFLCVKWMEFKGFLVVDWSTFNQFVGLDSVTDAHIQNMFSALIDWGRHHLMLAGSLLSGLYIGFKIG